MGATAVVNGQVGPVRGNAHSRGVNGALRCGVDHSRRVTSVTAMYSPIAQTRPMSVQRPEATGRWVPILQARSSGFRSCKRCRLQKEGGLIDASRNNGKGRKKSLRS